MPDESQSQPAAAFLALIAHNEHARRRRMRTRRRLREVAASVVIAALLAALGVELAAFRNSNSDQSSPPKPATTAARAAPTPTAPLQKPTSKPATARAATTRAKPLELQLTATRGPSWVEARENTADGALLYSGIVQQGTSLTVAADRIWVRFGSVGNLDLRLNGTPVRPTHSGTIDAVVTRTGLHG